MISFPFLGFCFSFLASFFACLSCKEQHQNISILKVVFINCFFISWFPVLLCLSNPLFLSLIFPLASAHLTLPFLGVTVFIVLVFLLFRFCFCLFCSVSVLLDCFGCCSCFCFFGGFF